MKNTKKKLNDKTLNRKIKKEKFVSDEQAAVQKFVFILIGIIVILLIVYGVAKIFDDKKKDTSSSDVTAGKINYDKVSIGTMLNRSDSEYYVMIYDGENSNAVLYSAIISKYQNTEKSLKIYYCDLGNKLNSKYKVSDGNSSNPSAKSIGELSLGDLTLIKVKNGKIDKYIEDFTAIKSELGM